MTSQPQKERAVETMAGEFTAMVWAKGNAEAIAGMRLARVVEAIHDGTGVSLSPYKCKTMLRALGIEWKQRGSASKGDTLRMSICELKDRIELLEGRLAQIEDQITSPASHK